MREWAEHAHGSPLYAPLAEVVASSEELLRVINRVGNWPPSNVFLVRSTVCS